MLPPIEPSLPLQNYILELRKDIKICNISQLLQDWHKKKFTTYYSASEKLKISESFYRRFITGAVPIPIWALKILCNFDPSLISRIYVNDLVFTARTSENKLPKRMTPQLAYYIGYLHGDGHIDKNGKRVSFTDKQREQLQVINDLTKLLFDVDGIIYFKKNIFFEGVNVLDIRRVTLNSFFSDILKINRGKRTTNEIPQIIKQNNDLLRWYICGLFDAEGAMPLFPQTKKNLYIDIAMTDSELIRQVGKILEESFEIKAYGPYTRLTHHKSGNTTHSSELRIRKQSEIVKYLNRIGTIHPDKIRRKELMLKLLRP